jgi:hypothetical protein
LSFQPGGQLRPLDISAAERIEQKLNNKTIFRIKILLILYILLSLWQENNYPGINKYDVNIAFN